MTPDQPVHSPGPQDSKRQPQRVLIVSSHPLFGKGIQHLLQTRHASDVQVVGIVGSVEAAMSTIESLHPDLVVVDHDDGAVNRDEFLARFVGGERKLRVVLFSLKEGGSEAIVYDRRTLRASQIDDWLAEADGGDYLGQPENEKESRQISMKEDALSSRKNGNRRPNMKYAHAAGALIFIAVLTVLGVLVLRTDILLPNAASAQAGPIDRLFSYHFVIIAFLFALIVGLMLYSVIFFRRKPGDMEDAVHIKENSKLEITWTIIPLIAVITFSVIGSDALAQTLRPDPKPLHIKVIGQQWSWRFEYPEQGIISTELYMQEGKQAVLSLTSTDVIHSFWVPEFRVKQDAVPGIVRDLRVTPSEIGEYKLVCAELCGKQHWAMVAPVHVLSGGDFDAWVNSQVLPEDPVGRGQVWYGQFGCKACHTLDGTKLVGPSFQGLYGHEVVLEDGTTVTADDAYIVNSIRNPAAQIVQGFPNAMPPAIGADMTDEQIAELIEFIKTLK